MILVAFVLNISSKNDDYLFTNANINYGKKEEYTSVHVSPWSTMYRGPSSWYQTIFGNCMFYSNIPNDKIGYHLNNIFEWIFYINKCKYDYSRVSLCIDRLSGGQFCRWDHTANGTTFNS